MTLIVRPFDDSQLDALSLQEPNYISKSALYRFLLQITWPGPRTVQFYTAILLNGPVTNSTPYLFPSQIICNTI